VVAAVVVVVGVIAIAGYYVWAWGSSEVGGMLHPSSGSGTGNSTKASANVTVSKIEWLWNGVLGDSTGGFSVPRNTTQIVSDQHDYGGCEINGSSPTTETFASVSTTTHGFNITGNDLPVKVGAGGTALLAITVRSPNFAVQGVELVLNFLVTSSAYGCPVS
jgi:hypothetical protein